MKKIILVIGFVVLAVKFNYSQETPEQTPQQTKLQEPQPTQKEEKSFRFGLDASASIAWLKPHSSNYSGNGSVVGFSYGFMADFFFTPNYAFSTGLDISYYGGKLKYNNDNETNVGQFHSQYIEIPLTLKMKRDIGYFSYFAQVGLSIGVKLSSTEDWNYTDSNIPANSKSGSNTDIFDKSNVFRGAFLIEGGIEYSLKENTRIVCGITFNNGLSHLIGRDYNNIAQGEFGGSDAINNSLGLTLGLFF